jgi:hypothetical protein
MNAYALMMYLEILCILRIYTCAFPLLARRSTAICQYYVCELSSQQKIRAWSVRKF